MTDNTDDLAIRILNEADDPDRFDNYADDEAALRYVRELKDDRDHLREQVAVLRTRLLKASGADEAMADQEWPDETPRSIEELRRTAGGVTVTLRLPAGARNDEPDGWTRNLRMSTVPHQGERVRVNGTAYRVHDVIHNVEHLSPDESSALYVVLR